MLKRAAPSTFDGLNDLDLTRQRFGSLEATIVELQDRTDRQQARIVELEEEIDELRRDAPRIAELYDLVFERLAERR